MTPAQRKALEVLAGADEPVRGWKYRSVDVGDPFVGSGARGRVRTQAHRWSAFRCVNYRSAETLCRLGYAERQLSMRHDPYCHTDRYTITNAGRQALAEAQS